MANHVEAMRPAGPVIPAPPVAISKSKVKRRIFIDRLAGRLVTLGGVVIIASILAILLVIVVEVYPLFRAPTAELVGPVGGVAAQLGAAPLAVGVEEYGEIAYVVGGGEVQFLALDEGKLLLSVPLQGLNGATPVVTSTLGIGPFAVGLSDGRIIPIDVKFIMSFPGGFRKIEPSVIMAEPIQVDASSRPIRGLAYTAPEGSQIAAAAVGPKEVALLT